MKISDFMAELAKTGVPYALLVQRFEPMEPTNWCPTGINTLEELIEYEQDYVDVINAICVHSESPEGSQFWSDVMSGKNPTGSGIQQPETLSIKEYLIQPWHLAAFNEGWEIRYLDSEGFSRTLPLEGDNVGHSTDLDLLKYIVHLHNRSLAGESRNTAENAKASHASQEAKQGRTKIRGNFDPESQDRRGQRSHG